MHPLAAEAVGQQIEKQAPAVTLRKEADKADGSLIEPRICDGRIPPE